MGVVIENSVPQLVSKELFNAVQLELAKNSKAPARHTADQDYLLTTKLICANGQHKIEPAGKFNANPEANHMRLGVYCCI